MSQSETPKRKYNQIIELLQKGAMPEAETLCRNAVDELGDVNFIALLGTILAQSDQLEEAEAHLRRAVQIAPEYPKANEELGSVLLNLGKPADAVGFLKTATTLNPKSASAFFKLGGALKLIGKEEEAQVALDKATSLSPNRAKLEEASLLFAEGKFRQAEKLARELVTENPRDVNAALLLARIAMDAKCFDDAEGLLRKIVEIAPRYIRAWHELAESVKEQHRVEEEVKILEHALSLDEKNSESHYRYAAALATTGQSEKSVEFYRNATELKPDQVGAYIGLGHVLKTLGEYEEGISAYKKAIELKPNFGEVYFSLSNLKTYRFSDADIEDMMKRIEKEGLGRDHEVHFAFTLGKALEDRGEYDRAFEYYSRGNSRYRGNIAYDPVQTSITHQKIRDTFTASYLEELRDQNSGVSNPDPIFILGLPRSGSTLLEQILASHSQVDGTSELPDLGRVSPIVTNKEKGRTYPEGIREMSLDELQMLGQDYMNRTRRHRGEADFFTDKMPNNFAHIGLIQAIMPNAKIIDARRHPLDSCVGCYKQHFARGQTFTYDLFELGEFYLEYDQMMNHWDSVAPGRVLRVQYEEVVSDLEQQVRRILDYCELPFEEGCVHFHETKRAVRTASSEQVRQPIYSGSIGIWKRFESHIEPLIETLEPLLELAPSAKEI